MPVFNMCNPSDHIQGERGIIVTVGDWVYIGGMEEGSWVLNLHEIVWIHSCFEMDRYPQSPTTAGHVCCSHGRSPQVQNVTLVGEITAGSYDQEISNRVTKKPHYRIPLERTEKNRKTRRFCLDPTRNRKWSRNLTRGNPNWHIMKRQLLAK